MEEQIISFDTAVLAKEKGFNWKVSLHYESNGNRFFDKVKCNFNNVELICSAPTQSLLQKWLDIIHNKYVHVEKHTRNGLKCYSPFINNNPVKEAFFNDYDKPEEAWEVGLQEALKLIKL